MADLPFLGCKISLISKCDIRYEGILYRVDAKESTIALSKVKSYGTETRGDPSCYIAPKEEVYDIIIFRASDVKDLRVDAPEPPGLSDPAIISAHHSYNPGQSTSTSTFNSKSNNTINQISTAAAGHERNEPRSANEVDGRLVDHQHRPGRQGPGAHDHRGENSRGDGLPPRRGPPQGGHRGRSGERGGERIGIRTGGDRPGNNRVSNRNGDTNRPVHSRSNLDNRNANRAGDRNVNNRNGNERPANRNGDRPNNRNGHRFVDRPNNRNGYRTGDRTGAPRGSRKSAPLKFEREYDFVKANELFLELEGKFKGMKVKDDKDEGSSGERDAKNQADQSESGSGYDSEDQNNKDVDSKDGFGGSVSGEFYDKSRSFFDSISCEASERSQGKVNKPDWRKERQLNAETFGVSAHYRRGGYRGRAFGANRYHRK